MGTVNIVRFLREVYTTQKLFDLLAHAQDGKLSYRSCCCFIGIPTAPHALRVEGQERTQHYLTARYTELGKAAEEEFYHLGTTDTERRERMIPLVEAEIARREAVHRENDTPVSAEFRAACAAWLESMTRTAAGDDGGDVCE